MKQLFDQVSLQCSRVTTHAYSTSFSLGIKCLEPALRDHIYAIYGFVRFADEIVDTFHDYDKKYLLDKFSDDTFEAIQMGISLNPVLNTFQKTVRQFKIDLALIEQFIASMRMDLNPVEYNEALLKQYILGSAEVVGLMCLRVFCNGDHQTYERLTPFAMSLGSAFQKVNFLRDLKSDYIGMGRIYFPGVDLAEFNEHAKKDIEKTIHDDFQHAFIGIKQLPKSARFGVYIAYVYYLALFRKIKNTPCHQVMKTRIRIPNPLKAQLLAYSYFKYQFNLI